MRRIVVTTALKYANGPIHLGHMVEDIQTDIWVRYHKMAGNECHYFCADDAHGTPIMIRAREEGITPEELIERAKREHKADFDAFMIDFDNYYTTHSPENKHFSELFFKRLVKAGAIVKHTVEQAYCEKDKIWLPDRFIRGTCPKCKAPDQYGDSCEVCSSTYQPTELIEPKCSVCGTAPVRKESEHYFFRLEVFGTKVKELIDSGYTHRSIGNKLDEWFKSGLKDWDISRDGPYFGFKIPGEEDKYFYVWFDAPIGYMASAQNYFERAGVDFEKIWNSPEYEIYHFIGKDIVYFHALFWPAMLMGAGFRTANKLFIHGFITVNGVKMSKSRGTFINASTYRKHLDPQYLRYYYAAKLTGGIDDIDLSLDDFVAKVNSDLVGKLANLASRSGPMLTGKLDSMLGEMDEDGLALVNTLAAAKADILENYEKLDFAAVVRSVMALTDQANKYVDDNQPWALIKTDKEKTRKVLTAVLNSVRLLTIYLKPVLPVFAEKIEKFLNVAPLKFNDVESIIVNHKINVFERLVERIEQEKVNAMLEESKPAQAQPVEPAAPQMQYEELAPECTIEDFTKIDLRIAKVISAKKVEGADKLLQLELDLGFARKNVFAGISKYYKPEELVGRKVVCAANLKPRKMKFGISEGMILAASLGDSEASVLGVDEKAQPGYRIH